MVGRPKKALANSTGDLTEKRKKQKELEESLVKVTANNIMCPSWVESEVAIKEFYRLAKILNNIEILTDLEVTMLANYCNCYDKFVSISLELENEPLVIEYTNKAGFTNAIENPKFKVLLKLSKELRDLGNELGINMSSRLKFATIKAEKLNNEVENDFGEI